MVIVGKDGHSDHFPGRVAFSTFEVGVVKFSKIAVVIGGILNVDILACKAYEAGKSLVKFVLFHI